MRKAVLLALLLLLSAGTAQAMDFRCRQQLAIEAAQAGLQSPDPLVRTEAIQSLFQSHNSDTPAEVRALLVQAYGDSDTAVALRALHQMVWRASACPERAAFYLQFKDALLGDRFSIEQRRGAISGLYTHAFEPEHLELMEQTVDRAIAEKDPAALAFVHGTLESFRKHPTFTKKANRISLRIRGVLAELESGNSPEALKAKSVRQTWFRTWDLEEDRFVEPLLSKEPETHFELEVAWDGKTQKFPGVVKTEWERRVAFRLPLAPVQTLRDTVTLMMDHFYGSHLFHQTVPVLGIYPLGTSTAHVHSGMLLPEKTEGVKAEDFSTELLSIRPFLRSHDVYKYRYTANHQNEVSTYFDSPLGSLKSAGIALRRKDWFTVPKTPQESRRGSGTSLFVKKTLGPDDLFTQRLEYEVKLPLHPDASLVQAALSALLRKADYTKPVNLNPIVELDNERYGLELYWNGMYKVGFVVMDSFTSKSLTSGIQSGPHTQWEVELLPEFRPLFEKNRHVFENFFRELETTFGGTLNPTPKYLQN